MATMTPELSKALDRAKYKLIHKDKSMFLSTILFSLKMKIDDTIPTASTNGLDLKINPDFFMDLRDEHRISLFAHEAWHVAFKHMVRRGTADARIWNYAADHVINLMLKKAGYDIPNNWLQEDRFDGMSTEEVYKILIVEMPPTPPDYMDDIDPNGQNQATQQQISQTILKASMTSKMHGQKTGGGGQALPTEIEDELEKMTAPRLPWDSIFRKEVSSFARNNYTFSKFNRRFFPEFFMPTLNGETVNKVCFAIDASASVSDRELASMFAQMSYVQKTLHPKEMRLVVFDTDIRNDYVIKDPRKDLRKLKIQARGGTDFAPVIEYFNKPGNKPELLVIFSDMDTYPIPIEDKPDYHVVWVGVNAVQHPIAFGKYIEYEVDRE